MPCGVVTVPGTVSGLAAAGAVAVIWVAELMVHFGGDGAEVDRAGPGEPGAGDRHAGSARLRAGGRDDHRDVILELVGGVDGVAVPAGRHADGIDTEAVLAGPPGVTASMPRGEYVAKHSATDATTDPFAQLGRYKEVCGTTGLIICRPWGSSFTRPP